MQFLKHLSIKKRVLNFSLFTLFSLFAIVQLNDPDAVIWFSIYITVALIFLFSNFKIIPKLILGVISILLVTYSMYHFSLFLDYLQTDHKEEIFGSMVYKKPYLEGSREFLGLLIAAFAIVYQIKQTPKTNKNQVSK